MRLRLSAVVIAFSLLAGSSAAQDTVAGSAQGLNACAGLDTDLCVVRYYKDTLQASIVRGRAVFQNYCTLCHGREGKGDGRAARLHDPRPFNLTQSVAPMEYIEQVVRKGGAAMNRGAGMPPWGAQLTDEQIKDMLNYLYSIREYKQSGTKDQ